jgi:hypothetical protein
MKREKYLTRCRLIRLSPDDDERIKATAAKLGFTPSEVTRRSLRIALPILNDLNLPGAARPKPESIEAA